MSTYRYTVTGMTCSHCVASVREEVGAIDGVSSVAVDLESGLLTVEAPALADADVAAAVAEAGYTAVPA